MTQQLKVLTACVSRADVRTILAPCSGERLERRGADGHNPGPVAARENDCNVACRHHRHRSRQPMGPWGSLTTRNVCVLGSVFSGSLRSTWRGAHVSCDDRDSRGWSGRGSCLDEWSRRGAAEVGGHLHPWTTPPFLDRPGFASTPRTCFPSPIAQRPSWREDINADRPTELGLRLVRPPCIEQADSDSTEGLPGSWRMPGTWSTRQSRHSDSWRGHRGAERRRGPDFRRYSAHPS